MASRSQPVLDGLWARLLEALAGVLTPAVFDSWLRPCHLVAVEGDHLQVAAPDRFSRDWLLQHHLQALQRAAEECLGGLCLPLIRPIGLMPPAAGIRDAVHRRAALSPLCPDSAAAPSEAWVRLSTAINVSVYRCSSRRTSTGSLEDAVRRSRRRCPGIHVESSRSPDRK